MRTIRLILAMGIVAGSTMSASVPAVAQAPGSVADEMLAAAFDQLAPVDVGVPEPASSPSVPDEGDPMAIRRTSVVTFDLGRPPEQSDLAVGADLGIEQLNQGSAAFGVNQTTATMVMVELDRPPGLTDNEVANVSLASRFSGQEVLASSPFANDPLLGYGTVVDRGVAQGETFTSYQQVVNDAWSPFGDPTATFGFYTQRPAAGFRASPQQSDGSYVMAWLVFGVPEAFAVIVSHAGIASAEALYFLRAELVTGGSFRALGEVTSVETLASAVITLDQFLSLTQTPIPTLEQTFPAPLCSAPGFEFDESEGTCTGSDVSGDVCVSVAGTPGDAPRTCLWSEPFTQSACVALDLGWDGATCTPRADVGFPPQLCVAPGFEFDGAAGTCTGSDVSGDVCVSAAGVPGDSPRTCSWSEPFTQSACGELGLVWDGATCTADDGVTAGDELADDADIVETQEVAPAATGDGEGDGVVVADDDPGDAPAVTAESSGGLPWWAYVVGLAIVAIVVGFLIKLFWPSTRASTSTREQREEISYRNRGLITPFMQEWGLAADVALGEEFGVRGLVGRWVFFESDPFLIDPDSEIPDGVKVVAELPDGEGVLATVPTAHREYRIGTDGSFLGLFITDPRPAASWITVQCAQNDVTMGVPTAWAHVWSDTRRLFSSVDSRQGVPTYLDDDLAQPDPEWQAAQPVDVGDAMQRAAVRLKAGGLLSPWFNNPDDPRHRVVPYLTETSFTPVVQIPGPAPIAEIPKTAETTTEKTSVVVAEPVSEVAPSPDPKGSLAEEYQRGFSGTWERLRLPVQLRGDVRSWRENVNLAVVTSSLKAGVEPDADGWISVSNATWYDAMLLPREAVSRPTELGEEGIFVNVNTLEALHPDNATYPGSERFDVYTRLMAERGMDPFVGNHRRVLVAYEDAGYVFTYDAQGRPTSWYRYDEYGSVYGMATEVAQMPASTWPVLDFLYDNIELNEAMLATEVGDGVIAL